MQLDLIKIIKGTALAVICIVLVGVAVFEGAMLLKGDNAYQINQEKQSQATFNAEAAQAKNTDELKAAFEKYLSSNKSNSGVSVSLNTSAACDSEQCPEDGINCVELGIDITYILFIIESYEKYFEEYPGSSNEGSERDTVRVLEALLNISLETWMQNCRLGVNY